MTDQPTNPRRVRQAEILAAKAGYKLHREDGLYALSDRATNTVVMGFDANGKPDASLDAVIAWFGQ